MDAGAGNAAAKVAEILRANPDGISRAGLMAWAQLRIAPDFTDDQLDAALAALGGSVSVEDGFVRLGEGRAADGRSAEGGAAEDGIGVPASPPWPPATSGADLAAGEGDRAPAGEPGWSAESGALVAGAIEGPPAPDLGTATTSGSDAGGFSTASLIAKTDVPPSAWVPGDRPSGRLRGVMMVLAIVGIVAFAIIGRNASTGSSSGSSAIPSDPRGSIAPAGDLKAGDCFVVPTASEFSEVEVRPCDAPHDGEVFSTWDHGAPSGTAYPTEADWQAVAEPRCEAAFDTYTGQTYTDQTTLGIGWFTPTEAGWNSGDRMVQCYLQRVDGGVMSTSYRVGS